MVGLELVRCTRLVDLDINRPSYEEVTVYENRSMHIANYTTFFKFSSSETAIIVMQIIEPRFALQLGLIPDACNQGPGSVALRSEKGLTVIL